jgi:SRSO17 transposase
MHHFVSDSPWDVNDVLSRTITTIKALPSDRSFSADGSLLIDDTRIEKIGESMEVVVKLYDHSESR